MRTSGLGAVASEVEGAASSRLTTSRKGESQAVAVHPVGEIHEEELEAAEEEEAEVVDPAAAAA